MIVLDTDHSSVLKYPNSPRFDRLSARLALALDEVIAVAVVTLEEEMRGWMACLAKERHALRQIGPYRELARLFEFFADFEIAHFDEKAAALFDSFSGIRIGTSDRKIAAIALGNDALLLTANRRDYERIPGLRFANWMDAPTA